MIDRNLARGLFLCAIALSFGLPALRYGIGTLSHAGPGLFPLLVAGMLLLIGALTIVRSRFVEKAPMHFQARNIAILLFALCAFALVSKLVNMTLGIVVMVLVATRAGTSYSVWRSLRIAAGLVAVAFAFQKLLGLNLPLL